jgi:hypothetical protein
MIKKGVGGEVLGDEVIGDCAARGTPAHAISDGYEKDLGIIQGETPFQDAILVFWETP